jgi:hypothetical protein
VNRIGHEGRRQRQRALVREALLRATETPEPETAGLIDAVPALLEEAARRRVALAWPPSALAAAVPLAKVAIPRIAAAAAVLLAISAALFLFGSSSGTARAEDLEDLLLEENGTVEELRILESLIQPED